MTAREIRIDELKKQIKHLIEEAYVRGYIHEFEDDHCMKMEMQEQARYCVKQHSAAIDQIVA